MAQDTALERRTCANAHACNNDGDSHDDQRPSRLLTARQGPTMTFSFLFLFFFFFFFQVKQLQSFATGACAHT